MFAILQKSFAYIADLLALLQELTIAVTETSQEKLMNADQRNIGALITRVALGIVLISHSLYLKLVVYGLPGTAQYFDSIGLPAVSAYVVFLIEAVSGIALVAGYHTRAAAGAAVPILLGATWAHASYGWVFSNEGGGWEYPLFLAVIAIAQIFLGPGALSLSKSEPAKLLGGLPTEA